MTHHPLRLRMRLDILLAIAQRLLVILGLYFVSSAAFNLQTLPGLRDGEGYLHLANGLLHGFSTVPKEDTQYFIGYPFFLSPFLRFLPAWAAVYLFQFTCIAGSLSIGARLFESPWITRWLTFCIPSYVLFTSVNMSESLIIFLIFAAIYAYKEQQFFICSIALASALITRPQSMCFFYLLVLIDAMRTRRFLKLLPLIFFPALFLTGMHGFNFAVFGDAAHNYRLYGAHESAGMIAMPFQGYIHYSQDPTIRITNRIYIWFLTGFTAAGLLLFWCRARHHAVSTVEKIFLYGGTLQFIFFMAINSRWGFMELPRYFIPVIPSALLGYSERIPKTWLWVILLGALNIAFAVYAEGSGNRYAH